MSERADVTAIVLSILVALAVTAAAVLLAVTAQPSTAGGFAREPTCAEWTDGCVVCQRTPGGTVCSTPGIACTRAEPRCLRRDGA
ncbi:hypothetical protein [Salinarimonas soli]|uniref:Uncharacterized protein n=1 Tax=Salinarimonas soli TaxID=1638099 RepID=A0A5B2VTI6_9HYPH|nr:hypothetical protein [Salinarimonas soli]KAA2242074.1 hypothetical protein F0L46_03670 [Salinarimonas soli]